VANQAFKEELDRRFGISPHHSADLRLIDDIGLDSAKILELVTFIDELTFSSSIARPPLGYPVLETVDDVFKYFEAMSSETVPM
jgi:acyl carrier protein